MKFRSNHSTLTSFPLNVCSFLFTFRFNIDFSSFCNSSTCTVRGNEIEKHGNGKTLLSCYLVELQRYILVMWICLFHAPEMQLFPVTVGSQKLQRQDYRPLRTHSRSVLVTSTSWFIILTNKLCAHVYVIYEGLFIPTKILIFR